MKKIIFKTAFVFIIVMGAALSASSNARACGAGDTAQVLWKGTWYPATVLKAKGTECFIHYSGYGSNWDEWVGPDRIKVAGASAPVAASAFGNGDAANVLWKGTWYPAHVIGVLGGGRYRIHYDGYDSSWDENVGPSRIRAR